MGRFRCFPVHEDPSLCLIRRAESDFDRAGYASKALLPLGFARLGTPVPHTVDAPETAFAAHTRSASHAQGKPADHNPKKKKEGSPHTDRQTMGSPPKFNIKKVKKRKEDR